MSKEITSREEYENLKRTIDHHMDLYYTQDAPEISDYEYDQLMLQLKAAEAQHKDWIDKDSPSQKVGGATKRQAGVKVRHNVPMLSIQDVFTKEEVEQWVRKVQDQHPDAAFSVEHKIDGLSMSLRMSRNESRDCLELTLAETRGDGAHYGEDVTANARVIPDVPKEIKLPFPYLELRGEVYMSQKDFEVYNELQEREEKKLAANPRNLAAGTLRQLDPEITRQRGLRMFLFNVQEGPEDFMSRHTRALDQLQELGVPVVPHQLCRTPEEVLKAIDQIGEERERFPYDIDGVVVKLDQTSWREEYPAGSKYSSGHIAYKFPPEERVITMDEILVDVGRTGKLTFTGCFHDSLTQKPARLCGTWVSRATLHNPDYIKEMKIGVGGEYRLFKSGEIIPKLNGCVTEPKEVFRIPDRCPVCHQLLEKEEEMADIRCVNPLCPAQITRTIAYFSSRDAMNIMGLGTTLTEALVSQGYLHNYGDIYRLKEYREELIDKGLIGKEKNTDKLLGEIEKSKTNEPDRLLTGLAIRNVGKTTARTLFMHFHSMEEIAEASREELGQVPDIGETTAECLYHFFHEEENKKLLMQMKEYGLTMTRKEEKAASHLLEGLTFVITGTLPDLGRKEAEELIQSNGGKVTGSVSKKTSYLLAGDEAGSKLEKARSLDIPVITQEDLLHLLAKG